jgi:hypothetical protein
VVLGLHVEDSDFLYAWGGSDGGRRWNVVVNPEAAEAYEAGTWALAQAVRPKEETVRSISEWSAHAPRSAEVDEVRGWLDDSWLFAEEAMETLLHLLGLTSEATSPQYEGAVSPARRKNEDRRATCRS